MRARGQNGAEVVRKHETAIAFAILIPLALFLGTVFMHTPRPQADALRYITYAVNMHDHGVFSLAPIDTTTTPTPQSGHAPLYPVWLAAFAALDGAFRDSLVCVVTNSATQAPCPLDFSLIITAQLALAGIFLGCVWVMARRLSGNPWIAWLAALCALAARNPLQYGHQLLTEALLVPLLGLFLACITIAYQARRPRWMLAAGTALALATLTRPAYAYLFYAMTAVMAVAAAVRWRRSLFLGCMLFAVAYGCVVAPWLVRNKLQFDRLALTTGYDGDILAQRVAYNRMSWTEAGVAFLYWFPDIGDNLAAALFPRRYYKKLDWVNGSYYTSVAPTVYETARREAGGPDKIVDYLLRTEILAHPAKHVIVSLPLAFRAVFIAKYWGIIGLICFIVLVIRQTRKGDYALLLLSLPIWYMVAFHAFVSISIPRYNLALIPFYAYAMACVLFAIGCKALSLLPRRAAET